MFLCYNVLLMFFVNAFSSFNPLSKLLWSARYTNGLYLSSSKRPLKYSLFSTVFGVLRGTITRITSRESPGYPLKLMISTGYFRQRDIARLTSSLSRAQWRNEKRAKGAITPPLKPQKQKLIIIKHHKVRQKSHTLKLIFKINILAKRTHSKQLFRKGDRGL